MKMRLLAALAVAAVLSAAGCKPATNYKYRIAVVPKGLTHQFWQSIHRGADRAAADLGQQGIPIEILWDGPKKESDSSEQTNIIQTKANMGISGLVLAPQYSREMVAPVQQVVDKHIPVVIIDSGLDKEALDKNPNLIVKYVATNNYHGGQLAARRLLDVMNEAAKTDPKYKTQRIVLFRYEAGSESTEQREKGFEDAVNQAIRERKPDDPTITWHPDTVYAGSTVDKAQAQAGPLLGKLRGQYPNEGVGIFAVNESAAEGMLDAMKGATLLKRFKYVGFDSSDQLQAGLRDGNLDGLIVQDPYRMGYLGTYLLVQHLEGFDVSEGGRDLGTGEHIVTRENLDDVKTKELFDPDLQAKRTTEDLLEGLPKFKKKS